MRPPGVARPASATAAPLSSLLGQLPSPPELPPVLEIHPGKVGGKVRVPPSKSYTHRACVVGALAEGETRVVGALSSEDTLASLGAVASLGGGVEVTYVVPRDDRREPSQLPGLLLHPVPREGGGEEATVRVGESGTTLRFFSAVAALQRAQVRFEGAPGLARRPMAPLLQGLAHLGARVEGPPEGRSLPFSIRGPIHGGSVSLSGEESSQFTSALLLVLPLLDGTSRVRVLGKRVSEPYVETTLSVLGDQGLRWSAVGGGEYEIPGGQRYPGGRIEVPGDASTGAYFLALGALSGGPLTVGGLYRDPPQADLALLPVLRAAGAKLTWVENEGEMDVESPGLPLSSFEVDLDPCPDLAPLLAVLAAFAQGRSVLRGGAHLVSKESDRRAGTLRLAHALGARAEEHGDQIMIEGPGTSPSLHLEDLDDHRMVMSAAVAAACLPGPSTLGDARAVRKSHPGFFSDLAQLGVSSSPAGTGAHVHARRRGR